jgi:hypothetical protein
LYDLVAPHGTKEKVMRWTMALVTTALLVAACGGGGQMTVHGAEDVTVSPGSGMTVQDAFPDVTSGSQVTVVDPSGKVIGTGTLAYAKGDATAALQWEMAYVFTVTVPAGETRYRVVHPAANGQRPRVVTGRLMALSR